MKRSFQLAGVLVVIGIAGCGGATKTVTVPGPAKTVTLQEPATTTTAGQSTASQTTQTATTAKVASTGPAHCVGVLRRFDIPPTLCVSPNGAYNEVATDNHAIHIPGMTVQFKGARTTSSLSDSSGVASAHANGIFLIITLKATNTGNTPQTAEQAGSSLFALSPLTSQAVYTESFQAENQADPQSFISNDTTPIQPGESQTGDVVFDVPPSNMTLMRHDGALLEWAGFGTDVMSATGTASSPIGSMIVYHHDLQN
jgi:hypothetical protein